MSVFIKTQDDWNKSLNRDKADTIRILLKSRDNILTNYIKGSDEQRAVGANNLDGAGYYELEDRLNRLLIGEGAEGDGLIGQFLKTDPAEYRNFVNNYGDGKYKKFMYSGNKSSNIEDVFQASIALLLNRVWSACNPDKYENELPPSEISQESPSELKNG